LTNRKETTMLTDQTRWSLGHGKPLVPSRWQATHRQGRSAGGCVSRIIQDRNILVLAIGVVVNHGFISPRASALEKVSFLVRHLPIALVPN
jgi:hypothetical protein